jgi:hypothetical protein
MAYEKARPNRLAFFVVYVTGIVTTHFPAPAKNGSLGNAKSQLFRGVACWTVVHLSMSSIKRDVKKKVPPRPDAEKIFVSRSSPLPVSVPLDSLERGSLWLVCISVAFIFQW